MRKLIALVLLTTLFISGCSASVTVTPSASPTPTGPTNPISFENLDSYWVSRAAYDETQRKISSAQHVDVKINYLLGPSLDADVTDQFKIVLQRSADVIGERYVPESYNAIYFGVADASWVDQAIESAGGDVYSTPLREPWSKYVRAHDPDCRMASAGIGSKGAFINRCVTAPMDEVDEISAHEYFHLLQSFQDNNTMPVWLCEGGATFFGLYVAPDPLKYNSEFRDSAIQSHINSRVGDELRKALIAGDNELIYKEILKLTKPGTPDTDYNNAYFLGLVMSEALVAVGGWDKWIDLNILPKGTTYAKHFKSLYGISLDEFYKYVSVYIASLA